MFSQNLSLFQVVSNQLECKILIRWVLTAISFLNLEIKISDVFDEFYCKVYYVFLRFKKHIQTQIFLYNLSLRDKLTH